MEAILFYILATLMIIFAVASVTSRKILRAVIYLLFVLICIAGLYFLINYNLLAAIQLTVYGGGVIVLFIFSVLLVHHVELELEKTSLKKKIIAGILSLLGLGITLWAIFTYTFKTAATTYSSIEVKDIGFKLLSYGDGGFILPFEVISVLLVAVMIGAIIVAKGKKLKEN
ncbi:MAG: NADH-quinone oxidoreductase subunit J [Lutibacter sp.]|uniref:NADH-quinone oxidoreductase subunit J family protein n=1 Tax=Lutibacter sp. TaxID=1925666 RepID=UPI00299D1A6A|nr:NADH-quinone oxidoreductase subunit J [Lutibacter sp.]MDX1829523.1 NADH-quinone oxidoreductase subunit J [Lutibacter sp.]